MEITESLWMAWSNKADIDEAWDEAKEASLAIFGSYFPATALYTNDFEVGDVVRPLGYWWRQGQGSAKLCAHPLSRSRDWVQRSVRVRHQGTDVPWPAGSKSTIAEDVLGDGILREVLVSEGITVEDSEVITGVVVSASRVSKKAVVTRYPAPSEKIFELRAGGSVVGEGPKSGPLVSMARGLVKEYEELVVWGRAGRLGVEPLVRITPEVTSASATLRITLGKQKDPEGVSKIGGWFFVGPRDMLGLYRKPEPAVVEGGPEALLEGPEDS